MRKLTTKQELFCNYFIKYGNATYSAKKAGYSKRSARQIGARLITKSPIQDYIYKRIHYIKSHAIADADEIFKYYTNVMRGKITDDVVEPTPTGKVYTGKKRPDVSERNQAAKELMKRYAPIEKAKIKKLNAEADIKNHEYKQSTNVSHNALGQTTKLLAILEKAGKADK